MVCNVGMARTKVEEYKGSERLSERKINVTGKEISDEDSTALK